MTIYCIICVAVSALCMLVLAFFVIHTDTHKIVFIDLEEIAPLIESGEETIIYFAKDECNACELNYHGLEKISENYKKTIYYYNASNDLIANHDSTIKRISDLGFSQAPSALVANNGNILYRFEGNVLSPLREYLSGNMNPPAETLELFEEKSLDELQAIIDMNGSGAILFRRDNCSDCEAFIPVLKELLKKEEFSLLSYNTSEDRDAQYDFMIDVLARYGVDSVPSIVILEDGEVTQYFSGENIVEEFSEYLSFQNLT